MKHMQPMMVVVDGRGLQIDDVVAVARYGSPVMLGDNARAAMERSAALVDGFVAGETPVYGVTTGFGSLANTVIPADRTAELQVSLVRSHATGMGDRVEPEVSRALLLLRARSLSMGYSGVRPELVEMQLAMINNAITPVVYEHGSLGASGDLAPLSHCALAMLGEGDVWTAEGGMQPTAAALEWAGMQPVTLRAKEGLALINGTDGILGMLCIALFDLARLTRLADVSAAMTVEGLLGTDRAFAADLQALRPQVGQAASARNLMRLLDGSAIVASHRLGDTRVQ
ncbi:MAG: histidine ammonia-lyase, partial [Actinomycetota bacterium]